MDGRFRGRDDDVVDVEPVRVETWQTGVPDMGEERRRNTLYVVYGLFVAAVLTGGLAAVIGVVAAYAKREDVAGTFYADHIEFLIRTFWISLLGFVLGWLLMLVLVGFLVVPLVGLWYVFRVVTGCVRLIDGRTVYPYGWLV